MKNRIVAGSLVFILTAAFFYLIVLINKQDRDLRTTQMDSEDYRQKTDRKIAELKKDSRAIEKKNAELSNDVNQIGALTLEELEKFRTTGQDMKNMVEWQSKKILELSNNFDAYKSHLKKIYSDASYLVHIKGLLTQEREVPMPGLGRKAFEPQLSGFVILGHDNTKKERAFIVTAAHLLEGIDTNLPFNCDLVATYALGKEKAVVELYAYDRNYDVALLAFKDPAYVYKGRYATLGKPGDSTPGSEVIALGSPNRDPYCISVGLLARKERGSPAPRDLILHTAGITFGNSGGPLLNGDGEVIGMNIQITIVPLDKFGMQLVVSPFAIAISVDSIKLIMPELERGSKH